MGLMAFSEFCFYRFRPIFRASFVRLLGSFHVICINQRFDTSTDAFAKCSVSSYISNMQKYSSLLVSNDKLHNKDIYQNVLSPITRDVEMVSFLSDATRRLSSTFLNFQVLT